MGGAQVGCWVGMWQAAAARMWQAAAALQWARGGIPVPVAAACICHAWAQLWQLCWPVVLTSGCPATRGTIGAANGAGPLTCLVRAAAGPGPSLPESKASPPLPIAPCPAWPLLASGRAARPSAWGRLAMQFKHAWPSRRSVAACSPILWHLPHGSAGRWRSRHAVGR